jgi:hypothetical protein
MTNKLFNEWVEELFIPEIDVVGNFTILEGMPSYCSTLTHQIGNAIHGRL